MQPSEQLAAPKPERSLAEFLAAYTNPVPLFAGTEEDLRHPNLTVRAWTDGDDRALLEVFGDPEDPAHHQDRSLLRPPADSPVARTLVVEDDGVPVGAASLSESVLHPRRLWFFAEIIPALRRQGLATRLLELLRTELPGTAVKIRYSVGTDAAGYAEHAGFATIQTVRQVLLSPQALPAPQLDENSDLQLEDVATGSVELTQAVQDFYTAMHQWDPTTMSIGQAQQLLLAPATGASGAVVLRDRTRADAKGKGNIVAFAISYAVHDPTAESPDHADEHGQAPVQLQAARDFADISDVLIGFNPGLKPELNPAQVQHALGALLGMLVHRYPVRMEVDDSMTDLLAVLAPVLHSKDAAVFHTAHIASKFDQPNPAGK
ncbi:GNAT family N-acetyltransferase [Micrococcoides hystricis]|uniref:GNAT family N-acetyltransferase n=1 Tax=Micrococcoides hystricis TaxID=1572761 RepID=A0ABV6PAG1_9MICC